MHFCLALKCGYSHAAVSAVRDSKCCTLPVRHTFNSCDKPTEPRTTSARNGRPARRRGDGRAIHLMRMLGGQQLSRLDEDMADDDELAQGPKGCRSSVASDILLVASPFFCVPGGIRSRANLRGTGRSWTSRGSPLR